MFNATFAIVDSNILTAIGLQRLLEEIIPQSEIFLFSSFEDMASIQKDVVFVHYFVSSRIFFEHTSFFRNKAKQSIILVNGDMSINGMKTLNVCQSENGLIREVMSLHHYGHGNHAVSNYDKNLQKDLAPLTTRETEVAILLCKGFINKEIAERLNISITTVISHRKNIMEKLKARSVASIFIYAVMTGIIDVADLK